jgi:hypothetical protein
MDARSILRGPKRQAFPLLAVWKSFGGLTELRDTMLKLILDGTAAGHLVSESPAKVPVMLWWHVAPWDNGQFSSRP